MKAKLFVWLTMVIFVPTYINDFYNLTDAYLVNDVTLMMQAVLVAIILYNDPSFKGSNYKIFLGWLILWRLAGTAATYLGDTGNRETAMQIMNYSFIIYALAILHIGIKWIYLKKQSGY